MQDLPAEESTIAGPESRRLVLMITFVLLSFSANSLITRHVVTEQLLDPGLLTGVRIIAGAVALLAVALVGRDRIRASRRNVVPALALGVYAVAISYGYRFIGAAAGTFVFYATVMLTLVGSDLVARTPIPPRRRVGAMVSLVGIGLLASGKVGTVTVVGVLLLALTGAAWGVYTAAGRKVGDPRLATTVNFALLAIVLTPATVVGVAAGLQVSAVGVAWGRSWVPEPPLSPTLRGMPASGPCRALPPAPRSCASR